MLHKGNQTMEKKSITPKVKNGTICTLIGNENIVFREEKSKKECMIFLAKDEAKKFLDKLPNVDYKYNLTELFDAWSTNEDRTAQACYVNTKEDIRWDKSHGWPDDGIKIIKDKLDEKPE